MAKMIQLQRPITSGSRQAPDPYDQYLESRGLYRKHTARDASSLFRVIAEQLYDTQSLHYEIRLECVRFMTQKRRIFEKHIPGDFDSYIQDMAKPKTYGTMTELRAMCCLYRRNAVLFEPYNMGTAVIFKRNYQNDFRVFYNNENHFDSVYKVDYIETAAICQSITFKLLYQMLFKLPDVNFAVESMLHPHTFAWDPFDVVFDHQGYMIRIKCSDGRIFVLDLPEVTNCILEDYQLCNFHSSRGIQSRNRRNSKRDLKQLQDQPQDQDVSGNMVEETQDRLHMCSNKMVSCVRQLLDDGITPFPYKVAKSLDPNMYRNIEFDCWNDIRKEAKRYNAYCNDYNFKVGAKCRVELEHELEMLTCHIQKISHDKASCLIFLEKLGKKILVPYDSLHPVPPDEFRPWTMPYRYQRPMNRLPHMTKFGNKAGGNHTKMAKWKKNKPVFEEAQFYEAIQFMPENYSVPDPQQEGQNKMEQPQEAQEQQQDQEQVSRAREREREDAAKLQSQQQQKQGPKGYRAARQRNNSVPNHNKDSIVTVSMPPAAHFLGFTPSLVARPGAQTSPPWPNSPLAMPEDFQYPLPPPPPPADGCVYMPIGGFAPHPTMPGPHPLLPLPPLTTQANIAASAAGVEPRRSMQMNGEDLPSDVGTLRYFYNMGVDMHLRMTHQPTPEELAAIGYNSQQGTPEKVEDHLGAEATPPATPDAGNGGATEPLSLEKNNSKRQSQPQTGKYRGKRPEQLHELKDPMGHAALLPTPTPSPGTNGGQFNFLTPPPPPPHHLMSPPRLLQPPPIFYHKAGPVQGAPPQIPGVPGSPPQMPGLPAGQNPYAWGLPPPPPSMLPHFEIMNNFPIDAQQQQQQQQKAPLPVAPQLPALPIPAQSQPAAAYGGAAARHH
ncbi:protein ovarian tumor locus isoform X2 [Drosophila ananassae]|uniref:protein ovarian tumor locus isoform X2 n=1 Tax=Drosophila ananassae TaxID=7217 RepID=UPI0013A5EAD1|nr:protein ovarian tumor locus isoform X2 [Drosophila ananassae]